MHLSFSVCAYSRVKEGHWLALIKSLLARSIVTKKTKRATKENEIKWGEEYFLNKGQQKEPHLNGLALDDKFRIFLHKINILAGSSLAFLKKILGNNVFSSFALCSCPGKWYFRTEGEKIVQLFFYTLCNGYLQVDGLNYVYLHEILQVIHTNAVFTVYFYGIFLNYL